MNCVCAMQEAALEAIQTLRIYFIDALHSNVTAADTSSKTASSQLLVFVQNKFEQYIKALLALFHRRKPEKAQLTAMMALLEAVRSGTSCKSVLDVVNWQRAMRCGRCMLSMSARMSTGSGM